MKKILALIVVAVIVIVAVLAFKGPGNNTSTSSSHGTSSPTSSNSQPAATNAVSIKNFAFSPANITVKKGTTVTWTNQDSTGHTVTESDGQTGPASQILGNGQPYSFTYDQVGTFHYHCTIHSEMVGSVTVTD